MKKRVLIELDELDESDFGQYGHWVGMYGPMNTFFDEIIDDAARKKMDIFKAIKSHDEIWVDSSYIGESGRLLVEMLSIALEKRIKNKLLVNMNKWTDVMWHIPDEARLLIQKAKLNNVWCIYADDKEYKKLLPKKLKNAK